MRKTFPILLLVFALFASACQAEEPELDFTPMTPLPQFTPGLDKASPSPEPTFTPTPDLFSPTPEVDPTPVAAPTITSTPTLASSPTPEEVEWDKEAYLASNLLEVVVHSHRETVIGTITDFVVDLEESQIRYALILVGSSNRDIEMTAAVPYEALTFKAFVGFDYRYYLDIDEQTLVNAPEINLEAMDFMEPGWDHSLAEYWQDMGVLEEDEQNLTPTPDITPRNVVTVLPGWVESRYVLLTVLLEAPVTGFELQPIAEPTPIQTPTPSGPPVQPVTPPPGALPSPTPTHTSVSPGTTPTPTHTPVSPGTTPTPARPSPSPTQSSETPTATPMITPTAAPGAAFLYAGFSEINLASQLQTTPTVSGTGGSRTQNPFQINELGDVLGGVENVIMEPLSGEILYILVMVDDLWKPIPLNAFITIQREARPAVEAWAALQIEPARLIGAPGYEIGQLPDFTDPDWDTGLREYWQVK